MPRARRAARGARARGCCWPRGPRGASEIEQRLIDHSICEGESVSSSSHPRRPTPVHDVHRNIAPRRRGARRKSGSDKCGWHQDRPVKGISAKIKPFVSAHSHTHARARARACAREQSERRVGGSQDMLYLRSERAPPPYGCVPTSFLAPRRRRRAWNERHVLARGCKNIRIKSGLKWWTASPVRPPDGTAALSSRSRSRSAATHGGA